MNLNNLVSKKKITLLWALVTFVSMKSVAQSFTGFTDAEIISAVVTANQVGVNNAEIALLKDPNPEVRSFATSIIDNYNPVYKLANELINKSHINPKSNNFTQQLLNEEKEINKSFKTLNGRDFERAYLDHAVAYHESVISAFKESLIPQVTNLDFKQLFLDFLTIMEEHLEEAQQLKSKF